MKELFIVQTFDKDGFLTGYEVKGEVVRCKDCKHSDLFKDDETETTMPMKCLGIRYGGVYPDWYCEHGERRSE